MVYLTITPAILDALGAVRHLPPNLKDAIGENDSLSRPVVGNPIKHTQVITLSRLLRNYQKSPELSTLYHLDQLLNGSRIYNEPPKQRPEPTSDYKALMARLRREEEARQYERMINPPLPTETFGQRFPKSSNPKLFPSAPHSNTDEEDEITYADINRQMALIINILISIIACSVAIWMVSSHWSTPKRLGLSMGGSGIIGVGEVVVYAGYIRRLKEARKNGKNQIEVKEIIKTWIIGRDTTCESQESLQTIRSNIPFSNNIRRRIKQEKQIHAQKAISSNSSEIDI